MSPKTFEFALTHYQQISLILIHSLKDPDLVHCIISLIKRADLEEAINFWTGPRSQWGAFYGRNFRYTYLFTHKKRSYPYLDHIRYFRKGFLQKAQSFPVGLSQPELHSPQPLTPISSRHVPLTTSESIFAVNQMMDKISLNGEIFRKYYSFRTINETLAIFQLYETNHNLNLPPHQPYLLIQVPENWSYRIYDQMDKNITGFFISSVR